MSSFTESGNSKKSRFEEAARSNESHADDDRRRRESAPVRWLLTCCSKNVPAPPVEAGLEMPFCFAPAVSPVSAIGGLDFLL